MKLLARYNLVNIFTTIIIMLVTGFAYYQAISWVLIRQNDKSLQDEETEVYEYINLNHRLPQTFETKYQQMFFTKAIPGSVTRKLIDTSYFKEWGKDNPKRKKYNRAGDYEPGRGLITSATVANQYYKIVIVESKAETEDLISIIFYITIGVIALLLLILFTTNRLILNRLWRPFYNIMGELKLFNVTDLREIPRIDSSIDEFNDLNDVVAEMASRAKTDYKALKAFTENASHELLTPIAVINSKLDTLIQTDNFSEKQSKLLDDLYSGISRLNRLNQSLLLLVKIENNLLNEQQHIDMREMIGEMMIQFEEIFHDKQLTVTHHLDDKKVYANRYLIEILLNNLIINAIRHNHAGGEIIIKLTGEKFIIQNTGNNEALPGEMIFSRFHKSSGSEGSGLGLTISKQICGNFNYTLNYQFNVPYHTFTITFPDGA